MQDDVAIRIFRGAKGWMEGAITSPTTLRYKNDILKLVADHYGEMNTHYINISKASAYSSEIQKEIILAELESIIMELDGKTSKKLNTVQAASQKQIEPPL
ncbi:MAG: hypothetical protein WBL87_05000, partial [Methanothrix sp.]